MSYARGDAIHSEPTVDTQSSYKIEAGDGFGTYRGWQIQTGEPFPSRSGINLIASQVEMRFYSDVLEINPKVMKTFEERGEKA